jgi:hypothetical protein
MLPHLHFVCPCVVHLCADHVIFRYVVILGGLIENNTDKQHDLLAQSHCLRFQHAGL